MPCVLVLARSGRGAQIRIPLRAMPVPSGYPVVVPKRRADCEASPRLAHHLPRPSPVPTDHPTSPSQARLISSDDAPAVALTWRRHRPSHPLPTRTTTQSTPERESLIAGQHTARQRSSLQVALQLGLSLLGLFIRTSTGPFRTRIPPSVLTQGKFLCAVYCIQWSSRRKAVGIPPRLISVTPASCDWRWLRICPPYAGF